MAQPAKRRGHGEDAIYWGESKGRWYGSVSLGFDSGGKQLRRKDVPSGTPNLGITCGVTSPRSSNHHRGRSVGRLEP